MANRLAHTSSPYLLQHAHNPVDWYPWGAEALQSSAAEDKPIFLSIGYAACHWCHVMAHESFEDPDTAALMNQHFINIKVDREERPDLDSIYMNAVVAITGQGGWPMSVFLTPSGQPFFGGTYFPPQRRYNMPSFREILLTIARLWQEDRPRLLQSGQEITAHLQSSLEQKFEARPLQTSTLEQASFRLAQAYDWKFGGWGQAPRFPQPMTIEFLLRCAHRGDRTALDMAVHALESMALGGMYDVVGGGFARYSTDNYWRVPHFEKMLYDNAQLSRVYLHAWLLTGSPHFRRVCEDTLDFILREMTLPPDPNGHTGGGFYSSLDADSEGEEGKFYVWSLVEIQQILSQAQAAAAASHEPDWPAFFTAAYAITPTGNFEGRTVLQRAVDDTDLAQQFGIDAASVPDLLARQHAVLLAARSLRVRPGTDDKILTAWNALMLTSLAEAARCLDRPDYLEAARRNGAFLLENLYQDGRLQRAWRLGRAEHAAYLEDYAALALGLLALYQSDPDLRWFQAARQALEYLVAHFRDSRGGFFDTADDHEALVMRPKDIQDNATPSGNALAAHALLQLSAYEGHGAWRDLAEAMLAPIQEPAARYPTAFAEWLCALDFALASIQEVAIVGPLDHPLTASYARSLWSAYRPHLLAAFSTFPPVAGAPLLLSDRPPLHDQPTAYVCQNLVCRQPVNTAAGFEDLLAS